MINEELQNYILSGEYPLGELLKEMQKDVKEYEKDGYHYLYIVTELPFYATPNESIKYRLFGKKNVKSSGKKKKIKITKLDKRDLDNEPKEDKKD